LWVKVIKKINAYVEINSLFGRMAEVFEKDIIFCMMRTVVTCAPLMRVTDFSLLTVRFSSKQGGMADSVGLDGLRRHAESRSPMKNLRRHQFVGEYLMEESWYTH
jgi:hypothetical protein